MRPAPRHTACGGMSGPFRGSRRQSKRSSEFATLLRLSGDYCAASAGRPRSPSYGRSNGMGAQGSGPVLGSGRGGGRAREPPVEERPPSGWTRPGSARPPRSWAPRGETPRLVHLYRGARVGRNGTMSPTGRLHPPIHEDRIRSGEGWGSSAASRPSFPGGASLFGKMGRFTPPRREPVHRGASGPDPGPPPAALCPRGAP